MVRDVPLTVAIFWPKPSANPVTWNYANVYVGVILTTISTVVVGIRLYTRHFMRHWLGWDDFWIVLAWVFNLGYLIALVIDDVVVQCNRHVWDFQINKFSGALKATMALKFLFTIAGTCVRQSLLCFYSRLVADADIRWFRRVIWVAMGVNIAIGVIFGTIHIVFCWPISAYWRYPSLGYGTCMNEGAEVLSSGIIIAVFDCIVVLLPIRIVSKLRMSAKSKAGVIVLLSLGVAASVGALVRCFYIWKALIDSYDMTWWVYPLWIATSIELNIAIVCACAPAIRPWVKKYTPWVARLPKFLDTFRAHCKTWFTRSRSSQPLPDDRSEGSLTQKGSQMDSKVTQSSKSSRFTYADVEGGGNMYFEATQLSSMGGADADYRADDDAEKGFPRTKFSPTTQGGNRNLFFDATQLSTHHEADDYDDELMNTYYTTRRAREAATASPPPPPPPPKDTPRPLQTATLDSIHFGPGSPPESMHFGPGSPDTLVGRPSQEELRFAFARATRGLGSRRPVPPPKPRNYSYPEHEGGRSFI